MRNLSSAFLLALCCVIMDSSTTADTGEHVPQINPAQRSHSNDPLHGVTLKMILEELVEEYGWDELSSRIHINCFKNNPSINSSLSFLRKTPWARSKIEDLYKETML